MSSRTPPPGEAPLWSQSSTELLRRLASSPSGLSESEASLRLENNGPNLIVEQKRTLPLYVLARQFRSPLVFVLLAAAVISAGVGDWTDATLIVAILAASTGLSFTQEYRASRAIDALRGRLATKSRVWRDGQLRTLPARDLVPGDIVELSAGALVPADGVVLQARDCFVIQAVLTGESMPVEKLATPTPADATIAARSNAIYTGTSVRSGTAKFVVSQTGLHTVFGQIAGRLQVDRPMTDFERGTRRFSALLTEFVLVLTVIVMSINLLLERPPLESLLFAVALAVGITPQLLPAIVSYTLSQGARALARDGVLVRRLSAIENLGSMTVLCSDKTGTLTCGAASLSAAVDSRGQSSSRVLELAAVNARLQTGLSNPLDEVILATAADTGAGYTKVDECPYDFTRKRMSVAVRSAADQSVCLTITKGAVSSVLPICTRLWCRDGVAEINERERAQLEQLIETYARTGMRVLAVASRSGHEPAAIENEMVFEGLLVFEDPIKPDIVNVLQEMCGLGVRLVMVTGDSRHTAVHVAQSIGIAEPQILTGEELGTLRDEALWQRAPKVDVFAEVDPNQKERIILALRKNGAVVGYIGDGINDAPALHAADVGISVEGAVDVAREAADLVLLQHDMACVLRGLRQGRITFANTQKYILSTTSANFGNMASMAAASAILPFLPLTAPQILLNNLLSDLPAVSLARDRVDPEHVRAPASWNHRYIRNFTIVFGLISSAFDVLTFATLFWLADGAARLFRSGWFLESLATEVLVLLAIRTRRPVFRSKPSRTLLVLTGGVLLLAVAAVQTPMGELLGFAPLGAASAAAVACITVGYVATVELTKRLLLRRLGSTAV